MGLAIVRFSKRLIISHGILDDRNFRFLYFLNNFGGNDCCRNILIQVLAKSDVLTLVRRTLFLKENKVLLSLGQRQF